MGVFTAWFVAIGLQTIRDVKVEHHAPMPSEFVASGAIFGALSLLGGIEGAEGLAGVLAWGILIALALKAGGPSALASGQGATPAPPKVVAAGAKPAPKSG